MDKSMFFRILNSEMELATGCTEPGAIALAAAHAGLQLKKLGDSLDRMTVKASANIIKNAMAAGIPCTGYIGIPYAAAIGACAAAPQRQLEVIHGVSEAVYSSAEALVKQGKVAVELAEDCEKLFIDITVYGQSHKARAVISKNHTNLILLESDGEVLLSEISEPGNSETEKKSVSPEVIADFLTIRKIYDFCSSQLDTENDPIDIVRKSICINTDICDEGMKNRYGLAVSHNLIANCNEGLMTRDAATEATIVTAAGADARMAGAPFSVVTNSGSGNQGITATMPVVALARLKGISEDKMLRAVTLSNLVAIRIKSKFGRLSALCGASVAGTGAACGITYLLGGGYDEICCAVQNMVGDITGMVCDGAKTDCALKISSCVNAAFQSALMALRGVRVNSTDGIVEEDVERTIENLAKLGNQGSVALDAEILKMMLNKSNN